ncbi:VOC family protein [Lysobacter korlensis]|uniref:VOC family protein n=1 Tax=Lysobacter korlensis TaxID=553636 RepID=A0ABV6RNP5_9GAMM
MTDAHAARSRLDPGIDRDIYPMPSFTTFPVADLDRSRAWYEALGFITLAVVPAPDGAPLVVHLRRMRYQDILLVPGTPTPGFRVSFAAGEVDLTAVAETARRRVHAAERAGTISGPERTPWYALELTAIDPDGYAIVLTAPLLDDSARDDDWSRRVTGSVL